MVDSHLNGALVLLETALSQLLHLALKGIGLEVALFFDKAVDLVFEVKDRGAQFSLTAKLIQ